MALFYLTRNFILELSNKPSDVVLFNFLVQDKSEVFAIVIYGNDTKLDWINLSNKILVSAYILISSLQNFNSDLALLGDYFLKIPS